MAISFTPYHCVFVRGTLINNSRCEEAHNGVSRFDIFHICVAQNKIRLSRLQKGAREVLMQIKPVKGYGCKIVRKTCTSQPSAVFCISTLKFVLNYLCRIGDITQQREGTGKTFRNYFPFRRLDEKSQKPRSLVLTVNEGKILFGLKNYICLNFEPIAAPAPFKFTTAARN